MAGNRRTVWFRRAASTLFGFGLLLAFLFVSIPPALTAVPLDITETTDVTVEPTLTGTLTPALPGTLTLTPLYALPGFDLWRFSYTEPGWETTLTGIIHKPEGDGPHPAVLISHGKGGLAEGFSLVKARSWFQDYISIAPNYTYAANEIGGTGPQGGSPENVKRAIRCLDILESQDLINLIGDAVDRERIYLYGNSMGGFVTIEAAAQAGGRVNAAAYTASGLSITDPELTPSGAAAAATIQAPFLMLHGQQDGTVAPAASQAWADALTAYDRPFQLVWFPEIGHDLNANSLTADQVAQFIRDWFSLPPPRITALSPSTGLPGDNLAISGSHFGINLNNNSQILLNSQLVAPLFWTETVIQTTIPDQATSGAVRVIVPVGPITDPQVLQPVTGGQRSNDLDFSVISNQTPTETLEPTQLLTDTPTPTLPDLDTPIPTETGTPRDTSTPSQTPTTTQTPVPTSTATQHPTSTASPTALPTTELNTLFSDQFDRADSSGVGNGWVEVETSGAQAGIQSNRLCFLDTSDLTNRPLVSHSFGSVENGELVWQFDFDWKRTGTEKAYRHFMQIGQSGLMSDANPNAGVGINLVWTALNSAQETLAYRQGGVDTGLATVSGSALILVTASLDTHTYQVSVNGTVVRSGVPFDNPISLDTVRYFTDGLNEVYFSGRCFDNVSIMGGEVVIASPSPTVTPIPSQTPSPTSTFSPTSSSTPTGTPTLTAAPTDTGTPTPTPTASQTFTPTPTVHSAGEPLDYVARWRFDEGTGTLAYDSSTNGNNLTLTNGAAWSSGQSNAALSLDGSDDYAARSDAELVGSFPSKSSNPAQHFSLSAWVKLDRTGRNQPIIAKQASKIRGFDFYVDSGNKLCLEVFSGAFTSTISRSSRSLSANTWTHVAVTYDYLSSTGSVIKLYLNGALDTTVTNAVGPLLANTQPMALGWHSTYNWHLDGLIDEARIYSRVLSEPEIAALAK